MLSHHADAAGRRHFGRATEEEEAVAHERFACVLWRQVARDQQVDVYMYAKLFHSKRPNVWPSRDDYMFLYRCVEALHRPLPAPAPAQTPSLLLSTLHTSFSLPLQLNGYAGHDKTCSMGDTVSLSSLPPLCTTPTATTQPSDVSFRIPPDGMEQQLGDIV